MIENTENLNSQAIELASQGCYTEAIACFQRALTMETNNYQLWYNLGITYRNQGDLEHAKEAVEQAYKLEPEDEDVLESLTLICFSLKEIEEAFEYCRAGLELNDNNAHVWNNLGVLFFSQSEFSKACEAFETAVTIFPHYFDALYNLRDTYLELGNKTGAEECDKQLKMISSAGGYHA